MKYLLDTHTLIWALLDPARLSGTARALVEAPENQILVSVISFWEISMKSALGKLNLTGVTPGDFPVLCQQMDIETIALDAISCATYHQLGASYHKDPFDRILIWQAILWKTPLISKDERVKLYESEGLEVIW